VRPFLREQQRQQRRQVRQPARAVVRRQKDRGSRGRYRDAALVRRAQKAGQLGDAFALDAHRERKRTELEVGDAAVEHLAHQVVRLDLVQRAGAVLASADFLDVARDRHDCLLLGALRNFQA
jgi:hypothetical protein